MMDGMDDTEKLPNVLAQFLSKLNGGKPETADEVLWLSVFRKVAQEYARTFNEDDSFDLSFQALRRCHHRGVAWQYNYLLRACRNLHLDHIRTERHRRPLDDNRGEEHPWGSIDRRMDMDDAVAKLGKEEPVQEQVIRLRRQGLENGEIARRLELCERQVRRTLRLAESSLRKLLGEGDEHEDL
jgi:ECF sigma factor